MRNLITCSLVAAFAMASNSARADFAYNNFGTGDPSFLQSSPLFSIGGGNRVAYEFQAANSGSLSAVTVAIGNFVSGGPTSLTLSLFESLSPNDHTALSGVAIATGSGSTTGTPYNLMMNSDLVTVTSFGSAGITAGHYYWLQATAASASNLVWNSNKIGAIGNYSYGTSANPGWANGVNGAFSVQVTPVPEPVTTTVLFAGLGMGLRRRRSGAK